MSVPFNLTPAGKVLGIGCDLVEISRISDAHKRHGQHFIDKIYSGEEQEYCLKKKNPYPSLAARFAAKEAIAKAFTVGIGEHLGWKSMSITHGDRNQPIAQLDINAQSLLKNLGGQHVHISLSHTDTTAMAFAVLTE
jgi:holo-[acyl-carrier protein] synthase